MPHPASSNGTGSPAPATAGSTRALHIMAIVQLRNPTEGRAYYDARKAAGKTSMEAMRCLKRRLSNVIYRQMLRDQDNKQMTDPGGHSGTTLKSSVTDLTPDIGSSDKPLPGPATSHPRTPIAAAS
jgi:transposase